MEGCLSTPSSLLDMPTYSRLHWRMRRQLFLNVSHAGRIIVEAVLFFSIIICERSNPVSWLSVGVDYIHGHDRYT